MTNEPDAVDTPDERRILGFYDRLRRAVERRGGEAGRLGEGAAQMLLLVPDIFMLVARMALDRRVPSETRALLGGALAYFLLPLDLVPEAFLGLGGYVDDLVISVAVLRTIFDRDLEWLAEEHWSGSRRLREAMGFVTTHADDVLSGRGLDRVREYLETNRFKSSGPDSDPDIPPRAKT